jgi:hypothetical protein
MSVGKADGQDAENYFPVTDGTHDLGGRVALLLRAEEICRSAVMSAAFTSWKSKWGILKGRFPFRFLSILRSLLSTARTASWKSDCPRKQKAAQCLKNKEKRIRFHNWCLRIY